MHHHHNGIHRERHFTCGVKCHREILELRSHITAAFSEFSHQQQANMLPAIMAAVYTTEVHGVEGQSPTLVTECGAVLSSLPAVAGNI